jgi:hypothetical protein
MEKKNFFLTITGVNHYYGMKPFEIGRIIKLVKDKGNEYDEEAIVALLPFIGKVGYVGNSPNTVVKGTYSGGRIYDIFEEEAFAQVLFTTNNSVICLLIPDAEEDGVEEENIRQEYEKGENSESRIEYQRPKIKLGFRY